MNIVFQNNYLYPQSSVYSLLYYMSGTVPQTPADVKAAVDLSDMSDLHSKCVGCALAKGTFAIDATSGVMSSTITQYGGTQMSWLKGGGSALTTAVGNTQYYALFPSRAYYSSLRKSTLFSLPPYLFSMPANTISNTSMAFNQSAAVETRDVATATTTSSIDYILEFDQPVTVTALALSQGPAPVASDYIGSVNVQVWNPTTSTWSWGFLNNTSPAVAVSVQNLVSLYYPLTGTKFKVMLNPSASTKGWYGYNISGIALLHTALPTVTAVPNITWGVMVPYQSQSVNNNNDIYTSTNSNINLNAVPTVDLTQNPKIGRQANMYGVATTNFPAIIDTCGIDSSSNMMVISQASNLDSSMHPTLQCYKYVLGELS
jgi:hypothetical protein